MSGGPKSYEASGGISELRPYEDGQQLSIELHRESFSVLWSAFIPAADFMRRVAGHVVAADAGHASLSPSTGDEGHYAFSDALVRVENGSTPVDFIRLDFADGAFSWAAPEASPSDGSPLSCPAEVGILCTEFRPSLLRDLIEQTATPHVTADIDNILASAERLTNDFRPIAE